MRRRDFLPAVFLLKQARAAGDYFPPADSEGGWRVAVTAEAAARDAGLDKARLEAAFDYVQQTSRNGGLLVARRGWLAFERYFGKGHAEAAPNLASVGKSFTSIAAGILLRERANYFPEGLDQRVWTSSFLPPEAFPPTDRRKSEIRLGQLLAMTAGIRGNNPGVVRGQDVRMDPEGPDGWEAMVDEMAFGRRGGKRNAITMWCDPGGGYSYATSSIHLVSAIVRHVTHREMHDFVAEKLARPLGWGRWGWGYRNRADVRHTPGGGGICLRAPDLLRFAYLLLHGGRWGAQQIVPEAYVDHCRNLSPYNPHYAYSLQFNVNRNGEAPAAPRDAFWKGGSGSHAFYVAPSLDLVAVKLGGRDGQYDPADTGLAAAPATSERDPSWQPAIDTDTAINRTLELVAAAVL